MLGILLTAILIVLAAVVIGRAAMLLSGWRRPEWMAGAVGLAVLVTLAPFLVRLPGRGLTAAIILAFLVAGSVVVAHRAPRTSRSHRIAPDSGTLDAPRAQHLVAIGVAAAVLMLACLPFLFNERTGILGEGIYTNDQAAQLYWADWLADGFGPQPNAVRLGYPVGPQALAASVSEGTGFNLVESFNGLLLAIPVLTALAALSALAQLAPWRRGVAAILTGLPYLGAAFLTQSGFKETAMGLFLLALAVTLHLASKEPGASGREPPPSGAVVAMVAILAAGSVFTFSLPGAAWFAVAIPVWALLSWGFSEPPLNLTGVREWAVRHRSALIAGGLLSLAVIALVLGPASSFITKIGDVQDSSGRLPSPVWPGEALGVWPEGDFRVVRGEVSGAFVATGFASLCVLGATIALIRRREWAFLAALVAAGFIYALSRPVAQIHVEAKALAILAPIAMLITVRWLLASSAGSQVAKDRARLAVGGLFCAAALASTFLALRAAPVGFDDRGHDLEALAKRAQGERLAFLGIDRFAGYWLRGTLARSPGGYVPADVDSRGAKTWQQGLPVDFDTIEPRRLEDFRFAITTAAPYQSTPPPSFREVARRGDYVLWKREGEVARTDVLPAEGGDPGAVLLCGTDDADAAIARGGDALVLERPVVGTQYGWDPGFAFEAPGSAGQTLPAPAGEYGISLQYHSQVALTVSVEGEEVARLPPSLEGFYLIGAGRGAFWPAGSATGAGDEVEVEVDAAEPSGLQRALAVKRQVWLGDVALTPAQAPVVKPQVDACGDYVDRYLPAGRGGAQALEPNP
ncbi:MAG: hypothetical protein M3383_09450 [Actinomycetota bacterium]|nr:hypothetical protein [Actinomycetota bacterium]